MADDRCTREPVAARPTLRISGVSLERDGDSVTLRADCAGFDLFYRFPAALGAVRSADPFVAACLLPAMSRQLDIVVEDDTPLSPTLVDNLSKLQAIFTHWEGQLGKRLHAVSIHGGDRRPAPAPPEKGAVTAFFSGGVDGTYTFLKHRADLDVLLFVKGIDMQLSSDALYDEALARNRAYLARHDKPVLGCETNVRFLGHEYGLGWTVCFGGGLSSIALAAGVKKVYLASGVTYAATEQEGSNYITDRLWSSDRTVIEHDGAELNRLQKLEVLAADPHALDMLRVCWQDKQYNCGECEKCLRTMVELRLLGITASTFPTLTDAMVRGRIARMRIYTVQNLSFVEESLARAREIGDKEVARALRRVRRGYLLRKHLRGLQSAFRDP